MHRSRSVIVGLLVITLSLIMNGCMSASASAGGAVPQTASVAAVTLRAASGATVTFKTQNGLTIDDVPPRTLDLPHLVLYRNGVLTDPDERMLIVEVSGIELPPTGVTVTLELETLHGDPDLGGGSSDRIPVWRASQRIANTSGFTQTGVALVFAHEFTETVASDAGPIPTPTDYFRYDIAVTDANHPITHPRHAFGGDHAFLMENQWVARLPEVQEESDGAAPDELVVYYCDMFPFQRSIHDPTTWLPREDVPAYVHTELVPQMIDTFRVQTDDWGFPWYDAWTSYRPGEGEREGEDTERLSVALTAGWTWFHGRAPSRGYAGISIEVEGGENARYDTLTDGIMSAFQHELFHNLQRNIDQNNGGNGSVDGEGDTWEFFSEGTAVLASSVGQPVAQFTQTSRARAYMSNANGFVAGGGLLGGGLNTSYERMSSYHAAIYWRFLYEQCRGMKDGVEDPAAGMRVIRRALMALYSGDIVDIHSSTDLIGAVPEIMDRALEGSSCPFKTHEESLVTFARAVYGLWLEGGRCTAPGGPAGCGFYDPYSLYAEPPVGTITYSGATITYSEAAQPYPAGIRSSFGIDFVDVVLDPPTDGQALTLGFYPAPGGDAEFNVQLWKLIDPGGAARPQRVPTQTTTPEALTGTNADGHLSYVIPAIDTSAYNRLGLIITRLDARESSDPIGEYTIVLHAGVDS